MSATNLRTNGSLADLRMGGAASAQERTQRDTRAQVGSVEALLLELADAREREAVLLRNLATELEDRLAVCSEASLMSVMNSPTNQAQEVDALMSVADVAKRIGVSARTVRRMRERREIPQAVDFGSVIRWRRSAIERWIEEREEASE